jgi:hypothetical protein
MDAVLIFALPGGQGRAEKKEKKQRRGFASGDAMGKSDRKSSCRTQRIADPSSR